MRFEHKKYVKLKYKYSRNYENELKECWRLGCIKNIFSTEVGC